MELEITGDILSWEQGSVEAFDAAQVRQSAELGEKNEAFQTSQEADNGLYDRYVILKELLQARYGDDDAKDKYYGAGIERREAEESTDAINNMYDADSAKLRAIYHWVVAFWGKKEPRLIDLGFVRSKDHGGGHVPGIPQNLAYDSGLGQFSWDAVSTATSYQVAYRPAASDDDWEKAYSGADTNVVFDPGNGDWTFRVRSRNANCYGDWGGEINVTIGLQALVIWELVYNSGTNQVTLQWHNSLGADANDIYQSVVPIGDPAGVFTLIETTPNQVYQHDVTTHDVTEYYYIIARNAEGSSDPTATVSVDVPA